MQTRELIIIWFNEQKCYEFFVTFELYVTVYIFLWSQEKIFIRNNDSLKRFINDSLD